MASLKRRAFRSRLLHGTLVVLSALARRLPLFAARAIGMALGHLGWHVARRDRQRAIEHLALAFPDWSVRQRRTTARRMFHHLGASLLEILWLPRVDPETRDSTTTAGARLRRLHGPLRQLGVAGLLRGVVRHSADCAAARAQ